MFSGFKSRWTTPWAWATADQRTNTNFAGATSIPLAGAPQLPLATSELPAIAPAKPGTPGLNQTAVWRRYYESASYP